MLETLFLILTVSALIAVTILGFGAGYIYLPWVGPKHGQPVLVSMLIGVLFFAVVGLSRIVINENALGGFLALSILWVDMCAASYVGMKIRHWRILLKQYWRLQDNIPDDELIKAELDEEYEE